MSSVRTEPIDAGDRAGSPARTAARAGVLAFFVDAFDIYLPVLVLAPAMGYFRPAGLGAGTTALLGSLVFPATLFTRPLGAAIFGNLADTVGRKPATLTAVAGFGVVTLLIAVLPGAEAIGVWSLVILIVFRAINGVFLGGEYTAAVPLALEWSSRERRGVLAGAILAGSPAAYATLAALTLALLQSMPSTGPASAYAQWGWRIPFLIGALITVPLFVHYRRAVEEPPTARTGPRARSPLVELVSGAHRRQLLQVFVLMSGVWLVNTMVSAVLPGLLTDHVGLTATRTSVAMLVASVALVVAFPLCGALSQHVGRRRFYIGFGLLVAVGGSAAYLGALTIRANLPTTVTLTALAGLTLGAFGPVAAYLTELFPAPIRATGFGVGYSLALALPAFYTFYLAAIGKVVPPHIAPVLVVAVGGALIGLGGYLGPETRDMEMNRTE
jgi:MFS family permease